MALERRWLSNDTCAICHETLENDQSSKDVLTLKSCGHRYHSRCFKTWYRNYSTSCCNCRNYVRAYWDPSERRLVVDPKIRKDKDGWYPGISADEDYDTDDGFLIADE